MATKANEWGALVCQALGLNPNIVAGITIEAPAGGKLAVFVELLPDSELKGAIRALTESLELITVERPDGRGYEIQVLGEQVPSMGDAAIYRWGEPDPELVIEEGK